MSDTTKTKAIQALTSATALLTMLMRPEFQQQQKARAYASKTRDDCYAALAALKEPAHD
jgi:hypothetical protein